MSLTKSLALLITVAFTLTACGDFFNKKENKAAPATQAPTGLNENQDLNPFPVSFEEPTVGQFSEEKLLLNTGLNVIAPITENFAQEIQIFTLRLQQACRTNGAMTAALVQQWQTVLSSFHKVDALAIGPMSEIDPQTKLDMRSTLYSWPLTNLCRTDKAVYDISVKGAIAEAIPYNAKGLDAIEYLLFANTDTVKCNLKAHPMLKDWLALPSAMKTKNRCDTAALLAAELSIVADKLKNKWDRQKGNYSKVLVDGSKYPTHKAAVNEITNALYALETVKDIRLGIPTGKNKKECTTGKCPERSEHLYSKNAFAAIEARLEAFKLGFFGGPPSSLNSFGIDDYLNKTSHPEIAGKIGRFIARAEANLAAMKAQGDLASLTAHINPQQCFASTVDNRAEELCSLYEDICAITSTMKTEVLVALSLNAPPIYQGDND